MEGSLKTVSDRKLLRGLDDLVAKSRQNEVHLLAYLAEVDRRQLYLEQGCSSMFAYLTDVLHFSEATAFRRIAVARAARRCPLLLERIREGALHMAGAKLLAPTLTPENHVELLDLARHKSKRAIEKILADRVPKPNVPARIRQLPSPKAVPGVRVPPEIVQPARKAPSHEAELSKPLRRAPSHEAAPSTPVSCVPTPAPSPLGGGRFRVQFTASQALRDRLREAQGATPPPTAGRRHGRDLRASAHAAGPGREAEEVRRDVSTKALEGCAEKRSRVPAHSGEHQASRLCPRRGSVCVRRSKRSSLRLARLPRVPPPGSLGQDGAALDRPDRAALSRAQ